MAKGNNSKRKKRLFGALVVLIMSASIIAFAIALFGGSPSVPQAPSPIDAAIQNGGIFRIVHYEQKAVPVTVSSTTSLEMRSYITVALISYTPPSNLSGDATIVTFSGKSSITHTYTISYQSPVVSTVSGSDTITNKVENPSAYFTTSAVYKIYTSRLWGKPFTTFYLPVSTGTINRTITLELYYLDPQNPVVANILSSAGLLPQNAYGFLYLFGFFVDNNITYGIDLQVRYNNSIIVEENLNVMSVFAATPSASQTSISSTG